MCRATRFRSSGDNDPSQPESKLVELTTVTPTRARDEQGAERSVDMLPHSSEQHRRVMLLDAQGCGELLTLQALAQMQVEYGTIARRQATGRVPYELAQVVDVGVVRIRRCRHLGQLVGR